MGEILIDNWSLERLPDYGNKLRKDRYKINGFLYALVFWDDIYSVNRNGRGYREYVHYDYYARKSKNICQTVTKRNEICERCNVNQISMDTVAYALAADKIYFRHFSRNTDYLIAEGAILYFLLGYNLGYNILISKERTQFLSDEHYIDRLYSRKDYLDSLDKEITKFYDEINKKIGKKVICFDTPVYADYICRHAKTFSDAIDIALQIKNEQAVIDYRKAMDKMEEALNDGNFVEFNQYISTIPEIVNSIIKKCIPTQIVEFGFNPLPNISTSMSVDVRLNKKKKFQLRFIKDIAEYGLENRLYRI